jgi:hypothetical protein
MAPIMSDDKARQALCRQALPWKPHPLGPRLEPKRVGVMPNLGTDAVVVGIER